MVTELKTGYDQLKVIDFLPLATFFCWWNGSSELSTWKKCTVLKKLFVCLLKMKICMVAFSAAYIERFISHFTSIHYVSLKQSSIEWMLFEENNFTTIHIDCMTVNCVVFVAFCSKTTTHTHKPTEQIERDLMNSHRKMPNAFGFSNVSARMYFK